MYLHEVFRSSEQYLCTPYVVCISSHRKGRIKKEGSRTWLFRVPGRTKRGVGKEKLGYKADVKRKSKARCDIGGWGMRMSHVLTCLIGRDAVALWRRLFLKDCALYYLFFLVLRLVFMKCRGLVFESEGCLLLQLLLAAFFSESFSMIQGKHQESCKYSANTYPLFQRITIRLSSIKGRIARLNVSMHAKKERVTFRRPYKKKKEPISVSPRSRSKRKKRCQACKKKRDAGSSTVV